MASMEEAWLLGQGSQKGEVQPYSALGRGCLLAGVALHWVGVSTLLRLLAEPGNGRWRLCWPAGRVQASGLPGRLQ